MFETIPIPKSIRARLLLAVNAVLVLGLGVMLSVDSQRELDARLYQKHVELKQQAAVLLPAVQAAWAEGPEAVQWLIDQACARMHEGLSPGHHLAVEVDGQVFQARTHQRASPAHFRAMVQAIDDQRWQASWADQRILVASQHEAEVSLYVSEFVDNIYADLRHHLLVRLGALAALGLIVTGLVNLVLLRLVARPLQRLVQYPFTPCATGPT